MLLNNISIGVDIEDIKRFRKLDLDKNQEFFERVYTQKEIEYCISRPEPWQHFAARFAAKEAVIKLISGFGKKIEPKEVEILNNESGAPIVYISDRYGSNIKVSMSHCKDNVVAFALGVRDGNA